MKKKIFYLACLVILACSATSCKKLTDCQLCKQVTRNSGGDVINSGSETQYCGADLVAIKAIPPAIVGGNTTDYECH